MDLTKFGFREGYDPNNRIVKQESIEFEGEEYFVSTVDLGLDHNFGEGSPLYFETMIFPKGTSLDMYCQRYTGWDEAEKFHNLLVREIKDNKYKIVDGYFELDQDEDGHDSQ